jgi:hypothetical protein
MISDLLRQVGAGRAEFLEGEAGHVIVLRLADQTTGALFYALNVRKP